MKKVLALILTATLALSLLFGGSAAAFMNKGRKNITPYGDFCKQSSHYGMRKHMLNDREVKQALKHYFGKKGLDFEIVNIQGRFVKAIIIDGGSTVDTIIFDRHTGRIRSIH